MHILYHVNPKKKKININNPFCGANNTKNKGKKPLSIYWLIKIPDKKEITYKYISL